MYLYTLIWRRRGRRSIYIHRLKQPRQIGTNCYAQSGGGAEGIVKNPRDKISVVFRGQDEIMRPNTEEARSIGVDSGGKPGHAPPIIKMGQNPFFAPPIIRREFLFFLFKKNMKESRNRDKERKYKEKGANFE